MRKSLWNFNSSNIKLYHSVRTFSHTYQQGKFILTEMPSLVLEKINIYSLYPQKYAEIIWETVEVEYVRFSTQISTAIKTGIVWESHFKFLVLSYRKHFSIHTKWEFNSSLKRRFVYTRKLLWNMRKSPFNFKC